MVLPLAFAEPWSFGDWMGLIGVLIAILGIVLGIVLVKEARETAGTWLQRYRLVLGVVCGILLIFGLAYVGRQRPATFSALCFVLLSLLVWLTLQLVRMSSRAQTDLKAANDARDLLSKQNELLNAQLSSAREQAAAAAKQVDQLSEEAKHSIRYAKIDRKSWDTVTRIKYGHLHYEPFLSYDVDSRPQGLGVELLSELFQYEIGDSKVKLDYDMRTNLDWCSIFTELAKGSFSIVATPLFSTFERTKQVDFTSPLFFSNVGLYVSQELADRAVWKDLRTRGLRGLPAAIADTTNLRFLSVDCEISDLLAQKHSNGAPINRYVSGHTIPGLLDQVATSSESHDVLFCESYFAERYTQSRARTDSKVVNVLKWHQILYPVCFAVQAGDYHLVNLLNIRLLDLAHRRSMLDRLMDKLPPIAGKSMEANVVKKHFVAEWPCPIDFDGDAKDLA